MRDANMGRVLAQLARAAIAFRLNITAEYPELNFDWLHQLGASFVTLKRDGQLRGCIGSLEARRNLVDDIQANAVAAAFEDYRFSPLTSDEYLTLEIEVSVLSPLVPMSVRTEDEVISKLRRGIDGLVIEYGAHRATFLPQVWEQLPDPQVFLAHLKNKAGLPADFWDPEMKLFTYQVHKYHEQEQFGHG